MKRLLVVNADDLGRTVGINDGIFEAHARGIVTSATMMVGFPAARDAAARLGEHPRLGIGLHVTLTGARPTLPAAAVPSLVDASGRLPRKPERIARFEPSEVRAEIRHQLDRFRELTGRLPTHLDSHHHSHRVPVVLEALIEVAREHRLPVRRASEEVAERLAEEGVATTDTFVERFIDAEARLEVLLEILAGLGPGSTEIMCHPGYPDDELRRESGYAEPRRREIDILTHPLTVAAVRAAGLVPARFDEA
ncbi:MAG: carbohydrate deacetylase [Acidobacteria bacterium]|nr:carbohydrate deacetylase [Acidobacteriota bacterium]